MTGRRAAALPVCLLALWAANARGAPATSAPGAAVDLLADYRRIEVPVPAEFTAECQPEGAVFACRVSQVPATVRLLLERLAGGDPVSLEFGADRRGAFMRFTLRRPDLAIQHAILPAPPRWVIEIGAPIALMGATEEEQPFRPYPLGTGTYALQVPPSSLAALEGSTTGAVAYNACFEAWRTRRGSAALDACAAVDQSVPDRLSARRATAVIGELRADLAAESGRLGTDIAASALESAELAAEDKLQAARYALLAARLFERAGFTSRAELHLETRSKDYEGTPGFPYVVAARVRLLMKSGDLAAARPLLELLRDDPTDAPVVGLGLRTLAGLAYAENDFVQAVALFDRVRGTWPELVSEDPAALFQAAELYLLYGRTAEASALYDEFLDKFPDDLPHWVVRSRRGQVLAATDVAAAIELFRDLAGSLRETEGQDMAYLQIARLTSKPVERRRLLRELRRGTLTDYVLQEMLVASTREALGDGRLSDAYQHAHKLWSIFPDSPVIRLAPKLFDRVLYLLAESRLRAGHPLALVSLYLQERARFEGHALRGEMHLLVGRAFRDLAMTDEAMRVLQRGVAGNTERLEPDAAARLYLEMAGVLREAEDAYRLGEILAYLDARHPRRFDDFEYWSAKASHALWTGNPALARDMYVYALNGPVTPAQRVSLAGAVGEVYVATGEFDRARRALRTQIELLDALPDGRGDPARHRARWRIAEIEMQQGDAAAAVAALATFIDEYPDAAERLEARYFAGRSLVALGDNGGALRQWDILVHEDADGTFGRLAALEREMIAWRARSAAPLIEQAGFARTAPPPVPAPAAPSAPGTSTP